MDFPAELKYTKDHEWLRIEGDVAYVGITEFAAHELGDIVYVDINSVGQEIKENGIFGSVEAVKTVSDLLIPVTGTILEINADLNNAPELVNSDPYGKGWMIKIQIADPSQLDTLLGAEAYGQLVA